jgi:hypothetical protein
LGSTQSAPSLVDADEVLPEGIQRDHVRMIFQFLAEGVRQSGGRSLLLSTSGGRASLVDAHLVLAETKGGLPIF